MPFTKPLPRRHGKAAIIQNADWDRICNHLHRGEPEARLAEQQRAYAAYLRDGSAAMTRNWTNSIEAIRNRLRRDLQQQELDQQQADREYSEQLRRADRTDQAERIAAAEKLLERAKDGPRKLKSAYLFADVLGVREQQRAHMAQLCCEQKRNDRQADLLEIAHNEQWMAERFDAFGEQRRSQDEFKLETRQMVGQRCERRRTEHRQQIAEERCFLERERQAMACEKMQAEREARARKAAEKRRVFEEIKGKQEFKKSE